MAAPTNRKTSIRTKTAVNPGVVGAAAGGSIGTADWHLRITALDTAARVNQTGDEKRVLAAAEKFYAFLTGK